MTHSRSKVAPAVGFEPTTKRLTDSCSPVHFGQFDRHADRHAVVYRFFDAHGELLYVGLTAVGVARWAQHSVEQPWWPDVASVTVEHFPSVEEAAVAERDAIGREHPRHNVLHRYPQRLRVPSKRRPNGLGSIFRRASDGLWIAQVSRNSGPARVIRRRYARTQAEALAKLEALTVLGRA